MLPLAHTQKFSQNFSTEPEMMAHRRVFMDNPAPFYDFQESPKRGQCRADLPAD
jgi:hypothetical protein